MGLPPRPNARPLVRRALVASVLASVGCDSGEKPAAPPETSGVRVVAPQVEPHEEAVAPHTEPDEPPHDVDEPVAPQTAYATGFDLQLLDGANKPLAKATVNVVLDDGTTVTATTDARGFAYVATRVDRAMRVTVNVRGYKPAPVELEADGTVRRPVKLVKNRR